MRPRMTIRASETLAPRAGNWLDGDGLVRNIENDWNEVGSMNGKHARRNMRYPRDSIGFSDSLRRLRSAALSNLRSQIAGDGIRRGRLSSFAQNKPNRRSRTDLLRFWAKNAVLGPMHVEVLVETQVRPFSRSGVAPPRCHAVRALSRLDSRRWRLSLRVQSRIPPGRSRHAGIPSW